MPIAIASLNFTDSLGIIFETHEIHLCFSKNVKLHNYSVVLLQSRNNTRKLEQINHCEVSSTAQCRFPFWVLPQVG